MNGVETLSTALLQEKSKTQSRIYGMLQNESCLKTDRKIKNKERLGGSVG